MLKPKSHQQFVIGDPCRKKATPIPVKPDPQLVARKLIEKRKYELELKRLESSSIN